MVVTISALKLDDLSFLYGMIASFNETILNIIFPGLIFLVATYRKNQNINILTKLIVIAFTIFSEKSFDRKKMSDAFVPISSESSKGTSSRFSASSKDSNRS